MKHCYHIVLSLLLLAGYSGHTAHIVGGEVTYRCLGNNNYEINLEVYRDCMSGGAPFDQPANIAIFNSSGTVVELLQVSIRSFNRLPNIPPNNCTQLPNTICTERAIYTDTVSLPPRSGGYTISYQRCCRNASINNVPNSGDWGSTYTASIPSNDVNCNSSPSFSKLPPTVLCLNVPVKLDISASDADGDSLAYSLCRPLHGGGKNAGTGPYSPKPDTALPPPYTNVPFSPGFNPATPIPSSPPLQINQSNGTLSIRPSQTGQYVFAICVTEYKNGSPIGTIRRDFQFNVSSQCQGTSSFIEPQSANSNSFCSGKTIDFKEQCVNTQAFLWDFGDPNTNGDTSRMANPTYTYSDTGVYDVMLIANPGSSCSDTSFSTFRVYDSLQIDFEHSQEFCFDDHSLDFKATGSLSSNSEITWNFGGNTNRGQVINDEPEPSGIRFTNPGTYTVKLTVADFGCRATHTETIRITERPSLSHNVPETSGCRPLTISFTDNSAGLDLYHTWEFGDGRTSNEASPTHVYDSVGTFTVRHTIASQAGCIDTVSETFVDQIVVYPVPEASLQVEPRIADYSEPRFNIKDDGSRNGIRTKTLLPNNEVLEDLDSTSFTLKDTGNFEIIHVNFNEFGCTDSVFRKIRVRQPINLELPTAFTPNNDGLNDRFSYALSGVSNHELHIYNRWGELVFQSNSFDKSWDGTDRRTGKKAPADVYNYRLKVRLMESQRDVIKQGTVTLIR